MKIRSDVIQHCINVNGYKSYLELGCYKNVTFDAVNCARKVGVDHEEGGTHKMSTDEFFKQNAETFDIVFIDADHHWPSVLQDVENSLKVLNPHGVIVMHDCNPPDERHSTEGGCWDAWIAFCHLRTQENLDCIVCDFDHGTSIIRRGKNSNKIQLHKPLAELTYADLEPMKPVWLNPQTSNAVKAWISKKPDAPNGETVVYDAAAIRSAIEVLRQDPRYESFVELLERRLTGSTLYP